MDDQGPGRSFAGGFLEFVSPAAVVGHSLAVEQFGVVGMEAWVVDQDHYGLPLDVHAGIIVPAALRRIDTVANEDEGAVFQVDLGLPRPGGDNHVRAKFQ